MHEERFALSRSDHQPRLSTKLAGAAQRTGATRLAGMLLAGSTLLAGATGCTTHHWAAVEATELPPPPGPKVVHTSRVVVEISQTTDETQCVAYEKYSPVCFYNVRPSVESGLARTLWPTFPEVVIGKADQAKPGDYVLQVELVLDALPPDDAGPGWSAGARSRFRLMRDGKVALEETLASRSRADFPYGAPLGDGATEVINATLIHIADKISHIEETQPDQAVPLPMVAARKVETKTKAKAKAKAEAKSKDKKPELEVASKEPAPKADKALAER